VSVFPFFPREYSRAQQQLNLFAKPLVCPRGAVIPSFTGTFFLSHPSFPPTRLAAVFPHPGFGRFPVGEGSQRDVTLLRREDRRPLAVPFPAAEAAVDALLDVTGFARSDQPVGRAFFQIWSLVTLRALGFPSAPLFLRPPARCTFLLPLNHGFAAERGLCLSHYLEGRPDVGMLALLRRPPAGGGGISCRGVLLKLQNFCLLSIFHPPVFSPRPRPPVVAAEQQARPTAGPPQRRLFWARFCVFQSGFAGIRVRTSGTACPCVGSGPLQFDFKRIFPPLPLLGASGSVFFLPTPRVPKLTSGQRSSLFHGPEGGVVISGARTCLL